MLTQRKSPSWHGVAFIFSALFGFIAVRWIWEVFGQAHGSLAAHKFGSYQDNWLTLLIASLILVFVPFVLVRWYSENGFTEGENLFLTKETLEPGLDSTLLEETLKPLEIVLEMPSEKLPEPPKLPAVPTVPRALPVPLKPRHPDEPYMPPQR